MTWKAAMVGAAALALGFWLGRATAPELESELASVDSFRQALEDPDWLTRSYRFSSFLVGLNPENLPDALEVLEPHLRFLLTEEFRVLMLAWARFDAPGAFAQAQSWPPHIRRTAGGAAMYAWGFRNPLEAVRELSRVEDGDLQAFWATRLLAGWAHGDYRDSAAEYIAALPESTTRRRYITALVWEIAKEGPETLMRWAERVPDDSERVKRSVFQEASGTLAGVDPEATALWLQEHAGRDYAIDALVVLARAWAATDPAAAMAWLIALPDDAEQREEAVAAGFRVWFKRAPADAEAWLRSASPAPAVDPAVRFMVEQTRAQAPEAARAWEARIAGET